ncbi:MAG: aldehyde dehydrogenase family protein [Candidatus Marinimicrobia bacterium]|nr:aldehyde dehydrogenase family protein [Candidatus Neomarinimicrobiota bacterium]
MTADSIFNYFKRNNGKLFFQPALLGNVNYDMLVMREETFGPIMLFIPPR